MEITIKEADEALRAAIEQRIAAGNGDMEAALKRIIEFVPECGFPTNVKPVGFIRGPGFGSDPKGDARRAKEYREREGLNNPSLPFFSEAYLYELVGKEDARTILALLGSMARALGIREAWQKGLLRYEHPPYVRTPGRSG